MERLTERDCNGDVYVKQHDYVAASERLAEYEDLEEQGKLLRLPCKVGTRIYKIVYCLDREFCGCCLDDYGYGCKCEYYDDESDTCLNKIIENARYEIISKQFNFDMISNFGKTVFITKEEAEAKLREMEE